MKAKIAITVSALLLGTITTANADLYIQSPLGLTQEQWNATDTYKNFNCPAGYGRGEGVDMNFTSTRADDYWFVSCSPREVSEPTPIYTTTPSPVSSTTPTRTETSTATVTPTVAPTSSATTTTAVTDTTTATSASVTVDSLYAQIMALFTQLLALIAKINR